MSKENFVKLLLKSAKYLLWILIWIFECFASHNNSYFERNPISWWIYGAISFSSNSSRDNKPYHNTGESLLLNLTTQPRFKLLSDDPYKSAIVAQRRCSKWYPCLENSLWRNMLRAHGEARLGGEMSWYCHSAKSFFVSTVGCGTVRLYSFSLSQIESISSLLAGEFVQLSVVMSQSILKSVPCPHKLCCCNSPGSCCPGELWWGYCWGWMTGRVLLWFGEPLRFLKKD